MSKSFWLNGDIQPIPNTPCLLIDFLRVEQHLTGTKAACREGDCGSCQVLIKFPNKQNWCSYTSCLLRLDDLVGAQVLTIESIPGNNPVIDILSAAGVSQCGFCSPGLVISVIHWLLNGEKLTEEEGTKEINANLCRCTGYMGQRRAIKALSEHFCSTLLSVINREHYLIEAGVLPEVISSTFDKDALTPEEITHSRTKLLIGGGTDLYLKTNIHQLEGDNIAPLINNSIVKISKEYISISARHSIQELEDALKKQKRLPSFNTFAECFASSTIRRRATLGGNLAHSSPVADGISYLMALEAVIETNHRNISINDFYTGYKTNCLSEGEVIDWIHIPERHKDSVVLFEKVGRRKNCDIAVLNCCGVWQITHGQIKSVKLVIGGASPIPVRLWKVEAKLHGLNIESQITLTNIAHNQELFDALQASLSPISDIRGTAQYRRLLAQQLLVSQWHSLSNALKLERSDVNA